MVAAGSKLQWRAGQSRAEFDISNIPTLRGEHNAQNAAAAAAVVAGQLAIDQHQVQKHMRTYPGLPHRMEEIGRAGSTLFINDSKATNADSTEKALLSFPQNVFWILGGKPKEGGIESLRPYFPGIVRAYLIGAASEEFARTLDGDVAIVPCGTLDVAVARAAADAAALHPPLDGEGRGGVDRQNLSALPPTPNPSPQGGGEQPGVGVIDADGINLNTPTPNPSPQGGGEKCVVLLSPACASYDQFRSFEHRGDAFRALVAALPGFTPRKPA